MTLLGAILKKVKSKHSKHKFVSPPPEIEEIVKPKKRKYVDKFAYISARVDASAPSFRPTMYRNLLMHNTRLQRLYADNLLLVTAIKKAHMLGKVDDRWKRLPPGCNEYHNQRVSFLKRTEMLNQELYNRIITTPPRVVPTASLRRDWSRNRTEMIRRAQAEFVLFPPVHVEDVEDAVFLAPAGVRRPRVYLTLRIKGCAILGVLVVELFTDVCPRTCKLFLELLDGDGLGHGYVGTRFFRKVPGLFWSGGDVIYNNGFGCYAQRGRYCPIGAENYHFSHSMPGLLSMRVTKDDEMCGIFNITFKALPQFDLRNEVFGRVIRPCATFDSIRTIGSALSTHPVVEITASRRRHDNIWIQGVPNTKIVNIKRVRFARK